MLKLNFTTEDITKPGYIDANPSDIWKIINNSDQSNLRYLLRKLSYKDFLFTPYWWAVKVMVKGRAQGRCQMCNSNKEVAVHHRSYECHGSEHRNMNELICLCGRCHKDFHKRREVSKKKHYYL